MSKTTSYGYDDAGNLTSIDITLQRGETYQLRNTDGFPQDLTGTWIAADKPVAVFGSHQCANVPDDEVFFCDYIVEQLLPVERAGRRFLSMPLAQRTGGDTFRFLAIDDGTVVEVNGVPLPAMNQGEFQDTTILDPAEITATAPILVTQYARSSDADGVTNADPFMVIVPQETQFRREYLISVPDAGFLEHFINVVAPDPVVGGVTLDGIPIPAADYSIIAGSGYSGVQVLVTPGVHQLAASLPFGVIVYGFGEFESYGFPGGLFFGDTVPPVVECQETSRCSRSTSRPTARA